MCYRGHAPIASGRITTLTFRLIASKAASRLFDDFQRFDEGKLDEEMFAEAPVLDSWKLVVGWAYALGGVVTGHPRIPDGREVVSSQLFFLDPERAVARTLNGWYRLGLPHGAERN